MSVFEDLNDLLQKVANQNEYLKALVTLAAVVGLLVIIFYVLKVVFDLIQVRNVQPILYRDNKSISHCNTDKLLHCNIHLLDNFLAAPVWPTAFRLYICNQFQCCQVNFVERYGQWAVITGSTDGIGQSMAKELARRGMSIIVVGRNETKLAATKTMLEAEPNVGSVETVKIDLSNTSLDNFASIRQQIDPDNRDIGILINNAGTFMGKSMRFNRYDMDSLLNMANLNMIAPLHITRMIMPGMVARGRGLILNVSSIAGDRPSPYLAIYSATKVFLNAFTRQLQIEYASHPIDIVLLAPGPVQTKLLYEVSRTPKTFLSPPSDDYARSAINALSARPKRYCGVFIHEAMSKGGSLFACLGVDQFLFKLFMAHHSKHFELSPVPKRKKLTHSVDASSGGGGNRS